MFVLRSSYFEGLLWEAVSRSGDAQRGRRVEQEEAEVWEERERGGGERKRRRREEEEEKYGAIPTGRRMSERRRFPELNLNRRSRAAVFHR